MYNNTFVKIINNELSSNILWKDKYIIVFLNIKPYEIGHSLVVPCKKVDHWESISTNLMFKLIKVAQIIGKAQKISFNHKRALLMVQGFEISHLHIHVWSSNHSSSFNESNISTNKLYKIKQKLRCTLVEMGYGLYVPKNKN